MPPIKFLVAVSSFTVALAYLLLRKIKSNQRALEPEETRSDSPLTACTIEPLHSVKEPPQPDCTIEPPPSVEEHLQQEEEMPSKNRFSSASSEMVSPETDSNCSYVPDNIPSGYFNDPENDIVEDSPEMFCGKTVPRVLIPSDIWQQIASADENVWTDTFCIPARMGGVLIGRFGKNVRELRSQWKAEFTLNMSPDNQDLLLFKIACPIEYKEDVLNWVRQRFKMRPSRTTIGNPSQLKRYLPFGQATPVQVRSSYGLKEMFVTVPDEKFLKFLEMQREMDIDYSNYSKQRMQLCEPVTSGTVSVLPHAQGFARALIMKVFHVWPLKYALYFLLDHGVFGLIQLNELRKIRAKYMRLPFQAIHVSWAHALPLFSDMPELHLLRTFFSSGQIHATAVRMDTCCRASVVFTDLMFVSQPAIHMQQAHEQPPIVPSQVPDFEAYPPLGNHLPPAPPQLKMVDVLAMCCRAGLYTVSPLVIYPSRQCWLNQSETPYFTFTGGEIDYQSYVSYVLEDGTINSSPNALASAATSTSGQKKQSRNSKRQKSRKAKNASKKSDRQTEEKENLVVTVVHDQNNNKSSSNKPQDATTQRPANNPWGLKPEKENVEEEEKPVQVVEAPQPVKLTMAQIAAMAPPPPPKPRLKQTSAAPPATQQKGKAKTAAEPRRRPLRSRNQPANKRPAQVVMTNGTAAKGN